MRGRSAEPSAFETNRVDCVGAIRRNRTRSAAAKQEIAAEANARKQTNRTRRRDIVHSGNWIYGEEKAVRAYHRATGTANYFQGISLFGSNRADDTALGR